MKYNLECSLGGAEAGESGGDQPPSTTIPVLVSGPGLYKKSCTCLELLPWVPGMGTERKLGNF